MRSFRLRMVLWFALSLFAITGVFVAVTFLHLDYELRQERWERDHPERTDWTLHGSYSQAEVTDITGELVRLSLLYAIPMLVLALAIGFHLAHRSMQPIKLINDQLRAIGASNLDRRVALTDADREFVAVQEQINELLQRLEKSFFQISEFSAQVAHELRTPLTLMRLQVEEAAGRIEPPLAESIQEELSRLSDYVNRCLLLARAEQGRVEPQIEQVDICVLLRDMIDVYELLAGEEHRTIEVTLPETCVVNADPTHLRQMIHNLLTNALKHGEGNITVSVVTQNAGALCRVENRISVAARKKHAGLGMGLRIVRALASLHPEMRLETHNEGNVFRADLHAGVTRQSGHA